MCCNQDTHSFQYELEPLLRRWRRRDLGKNFHPVKELELVEAVKQRRKDLMHAAVQVLFLPSEKL